MDLSYLLIAQQQGAEGIWGTVIMFAVIFLIFWFILIRPQKKEMERHQKLLSGLKKGDQVVTAGGIFGTVKSVDGPVIHLEISRGTKIKIDRQKIQRLQEEFLSDSDDKDSDSKDKKDSDDSSDDEDKGHKF
jgi:preprotein translocase subunit YajC